jgi:FkbM family methyltransferase
MMTRLESRLSALAIAAGRRLQPVRVRGLPRLFYKTAPYIFGKGRRVAESVSGIRLPVDTSEYASCMMLYGRYAPEIVALLTSLVRPGDSVLDIGAQLGFITAHLARLTGPEGAVHSIEPDPTALARLRETLAENHLEWVKVLPVAASDRSGSLTLYLSPTLGWSTAVAGSHLQGLVPHEVPAISVDELAARGEIRRPVKLAKIDVEGFEVSVIDGMRAVIAEDRPRLIVEVNPPLLRPLGQTPRDLFSRIEQHGYRIFGISEPRGVMNGGRFALAPLSDATEACDIFCVPEEAAGEFSTWSKGR